MTAVYRHPELHQLVATTDDHDLISWDRTYDGIIVLSEAKSALEAHYSEFVAKTIIRQCTQFAQASSDGLPVNAFAPTCRGAKDVDALIHEMMHPPAVAKEKSA